MRIKTIEDIGSISDKIIGQLVLGNLTYFSLVVVEEDEISYCFFSPVSKISKQQSMIMVEDYEKLIKLLLSHPKICDIEYNEKGNRVTAVFHSPYPADRGEEEAEF